MPITIRCCSTLVLALLWSGPGFVCAQTLGTDEVKPHIPARQARPQDANRREAVRLYGLAVTQEKRNRLIEATFTLEEARKLDPESAPILKALIPLYMALDRSDDAIGCCRKALELDPDDHDTGYVFGRHLRSLDRRKEAIAALMQARRSPGLKKRPELRLQIEFDLAGLLEGEKNWEAAEKCYSGVIRALEDPRQAEELQRPREDLVDQLAETYEKLGQLYLRSAQAEKAAAAFEKARAKDPVRAARLAFSLAAVYEKQGKPREALVALEDFLRTMPSGTEGYEQKVKLLRSVGRVGDVVRELQAAAARDPHNTGLRLLLAREFRLAGLRVQAQGVYDTLLKEAPAPEVFRGLFQLFKDQGMEGGNRALTLLNQTLEKAIDKDDKPASPAEAGSARAMLTALREDPDLVRLMLEALQERLGKQDLEYSTRSVLATLAARTKHLDAAESLYRSCLNRPGGLRGLEGEVYSGLLTVLSLRHKYEEVVRISKVGLEKAQATNRVLFHRSLARAYAKLERWDDAIKASADGVQDAGAKERLGCQLIRVDILMQAGKFDDSVAEAQALLKEYQAGSDRREVRLVLSHVYSTAGKHTLAEDQLKQILDYDPADATASNDLGYQWADRNKNLDEAERLIRKALDLDRRQRTTGTSVSTDSDLENAAFIDSLGWVLFRKGKLAEARQELEKASLLPTGEDDPVVWDHLGDVYFRLKDPVRAAGAWRKAATLFEEGARRRNDDRFKEIKDKLRQLNP